MRNQITDYIIVNDASPRTILIGGSFSFTKQQVRKVYNETQDIIYISPDASDRSFTLDNKSIIIPETFPVIGLNDILWIEIDYIPTDTNQIPTFTTDVHFDSTTVSFRVPETGNLISLGNATNLQIKKIGTNLWQSITLPYNVTDGDFIIAEGLVGSTETLVIQRTSISGIAINPGTLGSKIVNGCNNFAYYSQTLNKVLIGGLAIFDEDKKFIVGDGFTVAGSGISTPIARTYVEHNGYLYTSSVERGGLVRINLLTGETILLISLNADIFHSMRIIGDYLYVFSYTFNRYVNINTLSTGTLYSEGAPVYFVVDDGVSVFVSHSSKMYKVTGINILSLAVNNRMCAESGNYVYGCFDNYVYKIDKSTMTITSSISTNRVSTPAWAVVSDNFLYTIFVDGYMTKIDLSTFVSPSATVNLGMAMNNPIVRIYNGKIYLLARGATSFKTYNTATAEVLTYNLINDANSFSIDSINNRLIFYTYQLSTTITLKPVEIINIP